MFSPLHKTYLHMNKINIYTLTIVSIRFVMHPVNNYFLNIPHICRIYAKNSGSSGVFRVFTGSAAFAYCFYFLIMILKTTFLVIGLYLSFPAALTLTLTLYVPFFRPFFTVTLPLLATTIFLLPLSFL